MSVLNLKGLFRVNYEIVVCMSRCGAVDSQTKTLGFQAYVAVSNNEQIRSLNVALVHSNIGRKEYEMIAFAY